MDSEIIYTVAESLAAYNPDANLRQDEQGEDSYEDTVGQERQEAEPTASPVAAGTPSGSNKEAIEAAIEIEALRVALAEYREREERARERLEFKSYFPDVSFEEIPDAVYEMAKKTTPLAAVYALYLRGEAQKAERAALTSAASFGKGAGSVGAEHDCDLFSHDEISRMSRSDIRKNYSKIMRSLTQK